MPRTFMSSLIFALLASVSVAASAAPVASAAAPRMEDSMSAPMMQDRMMGKVNINTADADTLQKELSGIGKSKAAAIVAYREANGTFTSVDELIEVKGIGKSLLDKNRDKLAVE
jgi:competence protein ComEA